MEKVVRSTEKAVRRKNRVERSMGEALSSKEKSEKSKE